MLYCINSPDINGNTVVQTEDGLVSETTGKELLGEFFDDLEDAVQVLIYTLKYYDEYSYLDVADKPRWFLKE